MPVTTTKGARRLWLDLPLASKGVAILAVPLVCLLVEIAWLAYLHRAEEDAANWTLHTEQVQFEGSKLLRLLVDAETADRGYALTRDPNFLAPLTVAEKETPETITRLRELVRDNPRQTPRLNRVEQLANEKIANGIEIAALSPESGGEIVSRIKGGKLLMDAIRAEMSDFLDEEVRLLAERSKRLESRRRLTIWVLWGGVVLALASAAAASQLFSRGIAARLIAISRQGELLADGQALELASDAGDEIGVLARGLERTNALIAERTWALEASQRNLQLRAAELEAANHDLEAFSYSVSHDLRSPLRHIDGFSRILLEDFGGEMKPEAQRLLERVRQGATHMGKLIDELLMLGRIARRPLELFPVPLQAIAEAAVEELQPETQGRSVQWQIGRLPTAQCDPGLMRQVFLNLLSNAVKYTRGREPAVIAVGEERVNGSTAVFVRDNGVGFNMRYADKLFGLFQRLHRPEDFEGTGVGLATVARIIHRHGGKVWAQAEIDQGATFYFELGTPETKA